MKIVSIGEVLFDCFQDKKVIGGAPFNFFYHVSKITSSAEFISRIGNDKEGKSILGFLRKNNISTNYLQVDSKYPTGTVKIKLDRNGIPDFDISPNCAYDFIETNPEISRLIESETSLLYFGTLAQRNEISRQTIQSILGKDIRYFCDVNLRGKYYSKEILEESFRKVNVLKLNEEELKIISELFLTPPFELQLSADKLRKKFDMDVLCVTLGDRGAMLMDKYGSDENKYSAKKIVDTVGAGDAYSAILCLGYLNKMPINKINFLANKFAAAICSIKGAIPPNDAIYDKFKKELGNK
jgi:fructokinase